MAAALGEEVADLSRRPVLVIGQHLDEQRHPARTVGFVEQFVEVGLVAAPAALLDGAIDVVARHVGVARLHDGGAQPRIGIGIPPAKARGDRDLLDQLGEHLAALGVGGAFLVPDRMPFAVAGHSLQLPSR